MNGRGVTFYAGVDPLSIEKIMHIGHFDYFCLGLHALYRENSFSNLPGSFLCCKDRRIAKMLKSLRAYGFRPYLYRRCNADCSPAFKARCVKGKLKVSSIQLHLALLIAAKMSNHSGHYSIEELLALRESPLVSKPEALPQMEQWMQPAMDRRALQNAQPQ